MARHFINTSSQYLDCGTSALLVPGGAPFTLGCWARRTGNPAAIRQIINRIDAANALYSLRLNGTYNPIFQVKADGGTQATITGTETLSENVWYALCAARETSPAAQVRLYLNGIEVTGSPQSFASGLTLNTLSGAFTIGRKTDVTSRDWDGDLASAFFCNGVAATPQQAADLARGLSPAAVFGAALTAWWPLIGVDSPEPDVVSALNATLMNSATWAEEPTETVAMTAAQRRRRAPY